MTTEAKVEPLRIRLANKEDCVEVSTFVRDAEATEQSILEGVRGSELIFKERAEPRPNPEVEQRRAFLIRRAEERAYARMMSSVRSRPRESDGFGTSLKVQFTLSANVIVAPTATFFICYLLSRSLVQKPSHRIIIGLAGAIVMLFVELILYMARAYTIEDHRQRRRGEPSSSRHMRNTYAFSKRPSLTIKANSKKKQA